MAAAMCTLISPDGDVYREEREEQLTMNSIESASIQDTDSASTTPKDPAFIRLPDEIIELILQFTDPNSFASLIILNKKWRRISQQPQLYAHHLSRCRSYSASHHEISGPFTDTDLPRLRRLFAEEVKRNLFDCYLRPRETFIKLVSTSISSSAAFPGGEAFHFSFSPNGRHVLAYSSSRIYVLDVGAEDVVVKRELKISRRPSTATVLDDASTLALLSTDHQVDIYDISTETPKHTRVVALDHSPRAIALSPDGSVLAIGYEGGVEVYSLATNALPTDRRAVKCDPSDYLSFSPDGTQLLGTTLHSQNPSTVILTAPYYNPVSQLPEESISQLWTTSILFPNSSRDCSHATLLPGFSESEASWTFTYDKVFENFRAVRIDDLRNGTTYFTGPEANSASVARLLPSTLPASNRRGEIVAAGFQGRQIWLYGVPEDLDASPEIVHNLSGNGESMISTPTSDRRTSALLPELHHSRIPQWQTLADRLRNTFVQGRQVADLEGAKAMKWVSCRQGCHTERLVVVAPGIVEQQLDGEDEGMVPVDGGRLLLLDFQYGISDGEKRTLTIEVGNTEPQLLEEEQRDMATEVALLRRRTIIAQRSTHPNIGRLGTVAVPSLPTSSTAPLGTKSPSHTAGEVAQRFRNFQLTNEDNVSLEDGEEEGQEEAFDAPYSHTNPRSGNTLRRAATVAASHRRLHPRSIVARGGPVGMRRTDGTELPHESDADNWVPPPPPYSRDPIEPLPEHLRNAIFAGNVRTLNRSSPQVSPRPESTAHSHRDDASLYRSRSTNSSTRLARLRRTMSDEITIASSDFRDIEVPQPSSSPESDIYGVSPPSSPRPTTARPVEPVSPETEELSLSSPEPVSASTTESQSRRLMRATLSQPLSPIPQPILSWERASTERRLENWETTSAITSDDVSTINLDQTVQSVTQNRLQAPVPPRPDENHHVTSFNNTPSPIPTEHEDTEIEAPTMTQSSSDSSQISPEVVLGVHQTAQSPIFYEGLERPSDEQIARLNSRTGKPPARILTDPSRRGSGSGSPLEAAPRRYTSSGSVSGFNSEPRLFSSSPIANISEEKESISTFSIPSSSGRQRSGSGSSTRGLRTTTNMPPVSLDIRHRSWTPPAPGSSLTNLCELGGSDVPDDGIGSNNNTEPGNASELPVFAPKPNRPTYPTNADRRNSGYFTPPRVSSPSGSGTSSPQRELSPSRASQNQPQNPRPSPIRRRPVTSYNIYTSPSTNVNTNRRHSGLAFEIGSSSHSSSNAAANRQFAIPRVPVPASNQMNARSTSLVRLDTIRSLDGGDVDGVEKGDFRGRDAGNGRSGAGGMFSSWGRGRSRYGRERARRRETADWGELLNNASSDRIAAADQDSGQDQNGDGNGNGNGNGNGHGIVGRMGMGRNRSESRDRLSIFEGRKRSDRAVSQENKKRRSKKGRDGVKCVVM